MFSGVEDSLMVFGASNVFIGDILLIFDAVLSSSVD